LNIGRIWVAQRVSEGGNIVPEDKERSRVPRVLHNIKQTLPLFDRGYLLDNPFQQIAEIQDGQLKSKAIVLPNWAENLLENFLEKDNS
jgi:predicted ABC-type ATPase